MEAGEPEPHRHERQPAELIADEFDLRDLARYRKDSFHWYAKAIATNGADLT